MIHTLDVLPHNTAMYWNCIDDCEVAKTRHELLAPWRELENRVVFLQGDTMDLLGRMSLNRVHFAFLDAQHTYEAVMQEAGFVPHASFDSVSGVAAGLGDEPYWVFDSAAGRDAILAFYRLPENHPGWTLTGDSAGRLVFERQGKRMLVNVDERHVFFTRFEADTAHME